MTQKLASTSFSPSETHGIDKRWHEGAIRAFRKAGQVAGHNAPNFGYTWEGTLAVVLPILPHIALYNHYIIYIYIHNPYNPYVVYVGIYLGYFPQGYPTTVYPLTLNLLPKRMGVLLRSQQKPMTRVGPKGLERNTTWTWDCCQRWLQKGNWLILTGVHIHICVCTQKVQVNQSLSHNSKEHVSPFI